MTAPRLPSAAEACTRCRSRLADAEAALAGSPAGEHPAVELEPIRQHLHACPACAKQLASRLGRLESRVAIRSRSVPDGLLDGFYDRLDTEARMAPLGGGMSLAFLDAPRSLRIWRTTALAAGLLLATSVAWMATRPTVDASTATRPIRTDATDARDGLLPAWGDYAESRRDRPPSSRPRLQWEAPSRSAPGFFRSSPAPVPASVVTPPRRPNAGSEARRD